MKRLGTQKAKELEEQAPGITLSGWLEKNYLHVTLDKIINDGSRRLAVPQHNIELTIGLLSTDNVVDWARIVFHWAPPGTIVDKIPIKYYEDKVLLLRQKLTKELLLNPDNRIAQRYLTVLERRDADRWAQKKQAVSVKATAGETPEVAKNGSQNKKIVFDFEIVQ